MFLVSNFFIVQSESREPNLKTSFKTILIAIISIVIILLKPIIIGLTEDFFSTSIETQELIKTYISVRVLSVPAEFTIYILVGFYLGIQKTNISSLFIIILSALNIVFSSFFVLSLNLNVFGVALGTLLANYIIAIIFVLYTYKYPL